MKFESIQINPQTFLQQQKLPVIYTAWGSAGCINQEELVAGCLTTVFWNLNTDDQRRSAFAFIYKFKYILLHFHWNPLDRLIKVTINLAFANWINVTNFKKCKCSVAYATPRFVM